VSSLREELQRLGDSAKPPTVPTETWARARRANRQARLTVAAAGIALVMATGLAGLTLPMATRAKPGFAAGDGAQGVPSRVYAVPQRLLGETGGGEWAGPVETDLAIGRGAIAFTTTGPPVVIGADGRYHLLALPGLDSLTARSNSALEEGQWLAIAPSGRFLAYAENDLDNRSGPVAVRVVDLISGEVEEHPLGDGISVRNLVWSPNSQWLAWKGSRWAATTNSWRGTTGGKIQLGSGQTGGAPVSNQSSEAIAIDSDGVVIIRNATHHLTWDGVRTRKRSAEVDAQQLAPAGSLSPSGRLLALGDLDYQQSMLFANASTTHIQPRPLGIDLDLYPSGAQTQPLGWIDNDHVVAMVTPDGSNGEFPREQEIVVMTSPEISKLKSTYHIVARTQLQRPDSVTIAVDLMSLQTPTVPAVEPDWPWSSERKWIVFGIPGFLGLMVVLWWWGEHGRRRYATLQRR
jgi:hypothetical protein